MPWRLKPRCLDCLFNRLLSRRSKKTPKLRVTGLCEFPSQRASNTENVSIWWRQHDFHRARQPVSLRLLLRIHEPTKSYARPATVSRHSVVSFFLNCCGMAHIHPIMSYSLHDSYACPTRKTLRIHEPTKSYARPATVLRHSVVSSFLNCCGMAHIDRIISYSLQDSYACPTRKTI